MRPENDHVPAKSIFRHAALTCRSLSEAIPRVLDLVVQQGKVAYVRGEPNLEVLGADIAIVDPTDRLPIVPGRRRITTFCLVEFIWYCAQRTDLEPLEVYAPNISSFYGGMRSVTGSDYGRQLFNNESGTSQWDKIIALLRHDPGSKRAFMSIFDPDKSPTLLPSNLDVSCTTGFQVLIREGRLHWITTMRANDAYRGFVSDTFSFTLLQELLASTLGVPVGNYLHRPSSLHTFSENEAAIQKVLAARDPCALLPAIRMPAIRHDQFWEHLPQFWAEHDRSRLADDWSLLAPIRDVGDPWWQWVGNLLDNYHYSLARGSRED
jgi:thymidylate synthase